MAGLAALEGAQKVLVVDDDADWRDFLRVSLEDLGYEILEAADGIEALAALKREPCGVVLLDLHMPGMGGAEMAAQLPLKGRPTIVFLTAAPAQEVGSVLGSGPYYYLPKGATREQLSLLLQSLDA